MRVQVAPCERYRLRVTTWGPFPIGGPSPRGSGAAPHAVVLPGISADWRGLAPQIRALRGLGWTVHVVDLPGFALPPALKASDANVVQLRSEEHTSELQSRFDLVCRLLLEKK